MNNLNYIFKRGRRNSHFVESNTISPKSKCSNFVFGSLFNKLFPSSKTSQTTIFIILAIAIIAGILVFFAFREGLIITAIPKNLQPVYNFYLSCVDQQTKIGAAILGQQAGYIEGPDFSPGTSFMPFSSYLNFVGIGIPYWYYISGNGIAKEQMPSKTNMEEELNKFLEQRILECDFSDFAEQGFEIKLDKEIEVNSEIKDNKIDVQIEHKIAIISGDSSWTGTRHLKEVNSNLGKFYDLSRKIYDDFKETMFLENYGVDILRLYAPVDGVKIQCNPAVWNVEEIRENLTRALEANIPFIKIKGDYYTLTNKDNEYFVHEIPAIGEADANVNFLFSRNWPNKMEVWPNDQGLMITDPVGTQEGLGMLGFCYVPYHFVYDLAFPVLIQIYYNDEIFQFPVVVFINKNRPREPVDGQSLPNAVPELCQHKNTKITIATFNSRLEPIEADIDFKCFDTTCKIGRTQIKGNEAVLSKDFPQCGNGFIIANAIGYETRKQIFSTIHEGSLNLFLNRLYRLNLELESSGEIGNAIITFTKDDKTITIAYPEQKEVVLSSGQYEIKVYIYSGANIYLEGSSEQKCIEVTKSGVLGIIGLTEEKCFNLDIPGQTIDLAISGGGTQNYFISESELENSTKLTIESDSFAKPARVEDLQVNYNRIEISRLNLRFE